MNHEVFLNLLRTHLQQCKAKNSAYSVRALARKLDLSVGIVSEVLAGKRELALKSVNKVLDRLEIAPVQRAKILQSPRPKLSYEYTQLKADQYSVLSEWYYFALLNLIRTKDFNSSDQHIAKRLGMPVTTIRQALIRLKRLGLIKTENGKWVRTQIAFQVTDGIPNTAIRNSHFQTLDRARLAMEEHAFGTFDLSYLTFAFRPEDMQSAQKRIRDFQDDFAEEYSKSKDASEVYRLAVQLFSLTQALKPKSEKKK